MSELEKSHKGSKFTIVHCEGAIESFNNALRSVESRKQLKFRNAMIMQLTRLADSQRMSRENFPPEGELPKRAGQSRAKKFNALKRIPLRGYCWLSEKHPNTYFVSHYVHKDYDKLKEQDSKKVRSNWKRIEEDGYER